MLLVVGGQDLSNRIGGQALGYLAHAATQRIEMAVRRVVGMSGSDVPSPNFSLSARRLATSGVVSSSFFEKSLRDRASGCTGSTAAWSPLSGTQFQARQWSLDRYTITYAADLYQTSASKETPGVPRESR